MSACGSPLTFKRVSSLVIFMDQQGGPYNNMGIKMPGTDNQNQPITFNGYLETYVGESE